MYPIHLLSYLLFNFPTKEKKTLIPKFKGKKCILECVRCFLWNISRSVSKCCCNSTLFSALQSINRKCRQFGECSNWSCCYGWRGIFFILNYNLFSYPPFLLSFLKPINISVTCNMYSESHELYIKHTCTGFLHRFAIFLVYHWCTRILRKFFQSISLIPEIHFFSFFLWQIG